MFGLNNFVNMQREREQIRKRWERYLDNNDAHPWSEGFKMTAAPVAFDHKTWDPFTLFDAEPTSVDGEHCVESPCGQWRYDHRLFPRASTLALCTSVGRTEVLFDGDVVIPRLHQRDDRRDKWALWMSYTPQEVATLRPGVRKARGHVVIAGLGMGWMLARVLQRKTVRRVTLVEQDEGIVNWILPALMERHKLDSKKLDVIIDDANIRVPKLSADVALWDIWESLGDVDNEDAARLHKRCPRIGRTWCWGANARVPYSIW